MTARCLPRLPDGGVGVLSTRLLLGTPPVVNPSEEPQQIDLDDQERQLLISGLNQWGGPAYCTEEMAYAMGFDSIKDINVQAKRLFPAIRNGMPLSRLDWDRTLLATEIAFASSVIGAAGDWSIVTGVSDGDTLALLRQVQRKLNRGLLRAARSFGTRATRRRPMYWTPPPVDKTTAASLAGVTVEKLDEWHSAGLLHSRPMRFPNPELWWFGLVTEATVARHLDALGVTTTSTVNALGGASHTALIGVLDGEAFRVNAGTDLFPTEPVLVLDIGAFADELRQRWPTGPETRWEPPPITRPPRPRG